MYGSVLMAEFFSGFLHRVRSLNRTIFIVAVAIAVTAVAGSSLHIFDWLELTIGDYAAVRLWLLGLAIAVFLLSLYVGVPPQELAVHLFGRVPPVPLHVVRRPSIESRARGKLRRGKSTALVGMGGSGKTVLAGLLARAPQVWRQYPDGVVWLSVGQHADLLDLQTTMARLVGDPLISFATSAEAEAYVATVLQSRRTLLVLDDVWAPSAIQSLGLVGPAGAVLITTRDRAAVRDSVRDEDLVEVSDLELSQARDLLKNWTGRRELPPLADAICGQVRRLPLAVAIAGGMVRVRGGEKQAWQEVYEILRAREVQAIALRYPPDSYQYPTLIAAIEAGIEDLSDDLRARYLELAVFKGLSPMPPSAIYALWARMGFSDAAALATINDLVDRSLVERLDDGWLTLHDLQFDVVARASSSQITTSHGALIAGYRARCASDQLWNGPNDGYFFENITAHLAVADEGELRQLLTSYLWLKTKLVTTSVASLLADFARARGLGDAVDLLNEVVQLAAPALASDPNLLAGQLHGRLQVFATDETSRLLQEAIDLETNPWFRPRRQSLIQPRGALERTLVVGQAVDDVAFTPDGRDIVAVGGSLHVYDVRDSRPGHAIEDPLPTLSAAAISADGQHYAAGLHSDGGITVHNRWSGRVEMRLPGLDTPQPTRAEILSLNTLTFSGDGGRLIGGYDDGTVVVWRVARGVVEASVRLSSEPIKDVVALGDTIFAASLDGSIYSLDALTGNILTKLAGHRGGTTGLTHYAGLILSCGHDGVVRGWHLDGTPGPVFDGPASGLLAVACADDGSLVASVDRQGTLTLWDSATQASRGSIRAHSGAATCVSFHPDGQLLLTGGFDGLVRVWRIDQFSSGQSDLQPAQIGLLAAMPDGSRIVRATSDGYLTFVDTESLEPQFEVAVQGADIRALAISQDGSHVAAALANGPIAMVRVDAGGAVMDRLIVVSSPVSALTFSADGARLFAGGRDAIVVIVVDSGDLEHSFLNSGGYVHDVAIGDSPKLFVADENGITVWDVTQGRVRQEFVAGDDDDATWSIALTGDRLLSGHPHGHFRWWDQRTGELERDIQSDDLTAFEYVAGGGRPDVSITGGPTQIVAWAASSSDAIARWLPDYEMSARCVVPSRPRPTVAYVDPMYGIQVVELLSAS